MAMEIERKTSDENAAVTDAVVPFSLSGKLGLGVPLSLSDTDGEGIISFPAPNIKDLLSFFRLGVKSSEASSSLDITQFSIASEDWATCLSVISESLGVFLQAGSGVGLRCVGLRIDLARPTSPPTTDLAEIEADSSEKKIGRLFIQLPSTFKGGVAYTQQSSRRYKHFLGADDGSNEIDLHYLFVMAGASHMTTRLSKGMRVFLVYDVIGDPSFTPRPETPLSFRPVTDVDSLLQSLYRSALEKQDPKSLLTQFQSLFNLNPTFVTQADADKVLELAVYIGHPSTAASAIQAVKIVSPLFFHILRRFPKLEGALIRQLETIDLGYFLRPALTVAWELLEANLCPKVVDVVARRFSADLKDIKDPATINLGYKLIYQLNTPELTEVALKGITGGKAQSTLLEELRAEFGEEETSANAFYNDLARRRKMKLRKLVEDGEPQYSLILPVNIVPAKNSNAMEEINDFLSSDADEFVFYGTQISWKRIMEAKESLMSDYGLEVDVDKPHGEPPTTSFKKTKYKYEKDLEDYNWRMEELRTLGSIPDPPPAPRTTRTPRAKLPPLDPSEKRFKCELCSYATNHNQEFGYHMNKHLGIKPFKCPHCDYATEYRSNLRHHINARHNRDGE